MLLEQWKSSYGFLTSEIESRVSYFVGVKLEEIWSNVREDHLSLIGLVFGEVNHFWITYPSIVLIRIRCWNSPWMTRRMQGLSLYHPISRMRKYVLEKSFANLL